MLARVQAPGEHGGELGDQLAEREGQVLGQVRPRGVAALAVEQDVERVGRTGERPLAQADGADVDPGIGVQPEDAVDAVERAGLDGHQGAARHDLLRWLEDQTHAARQTVGDRGQGEPGPEQAGRVQVVAAGVRDTLDRALPRVTGAVVDREGVEVRAQGDERSVAGADVDHQPVAWQQSRHQAELVQPLGDQGGGALLGPRELGVGMQVTSYVDQLVRLRVDTREH